MRKKNTAATMKDVAEEAGVSLGTVSRVLNGLAVGDDYRRKVEEACDRLGYQMKHGPSGARAELAGVVALIVPSIQHPYFAMLANSVCRELEKRGMKMLLALSEYSPGIEQKCIDMVRQGRADGIIGLTYNPSLFVAASVPFVSIDRYYSSYVPCISSDNFGGGQLAARKLIEFGCRELLFIRSGSDVTGEPDKRGIGFEMVCREENVPCHSIRVRDEDGIGKIFNWLDNYIKEGKPTFDGIFCSTDLMADAVIRKLREKGIRVPEDVQVIGYDGICQLSNPDRPVCSTIVQPTNRIAEMAVDVLLSENRSTLPLLTCLPVSFREGGTTMRKGEGLGQ